MVLPADSSSNQPLSTRGVPSIAMLLRCLLLALTLLAFGRLIWELDTKDLWWDESLSLQRAESSLWTILRNAIVITDGVREMTTLDQHPFFFFLLQSIFVRLGGTSEFSLRFVSVMAATLLVPATWGMGQFFVRRQLWPGSSPYWSALLVAISPFYLWYGQEARPYALWSLLAIVSTYLLLRAMESSGRWSRWQIGFVIVELMFLTTHYFATFLLPVHALLLFLWLRRHSLRLAILVAGGVLAAVGLAAGAIGWILLQRGGGINFHWVEPKILFADLLNAFTLGPSADPIGVWWLLDLLYGGVALLGLVWAVRNGTQFRRGGWLTWGLIVTPILVILLVNMVQPAYMNSRHMSLIGGGYLLALGGGFGVIWRYQRLVAVALAVVLLVGIGNSNMRYFADEQYDKDDFTSLGSLLERRILPGDAVLLNPTFSRRIFQYYLPLDEIEAAEADGAYVHVAGVPLVQRPWDETFAQLADVRERYQRIWLITSGTHPHLDPDEQIRAWLMDRMYRVQEHTFFSHSSLKAELFTPIPPVYNEPIAIVGHEIDVLFGEQIRLIGYRAGPPLYSGAPMPITLYWQTEAQTDQRYKYILRVVQVESDAASDGGGRVLAVTEREPYDGALATHFWQPGQTIVEQSELLPLANVLTDTPAGVDLYTGLVAGDYRLEVEVYNRASLEKLPVNRANGDGITANELHIEINVQPAP